MAGTTAQMMFELALSKDTYYAKETWNTSQVSDPCSPEYLRGQRPGLRRAAHNDDTEPRVQPAKSTALKAKVTSKCTTQLP